MSFDLDVLQKHLGQVGVLLVAAGVVDGGFGSGGLFRPALIATTGVMLILTAAYKQR